MKLKQREINGNYQKWEIILMDFDFAIKYNPDSNNLVADALSRIPKPVIELGAILSSCGIEYWGLLKKEVLKIITLVRIRKVVLIGKQAPARCTLESNILYFKGRYVIAKSSPFISVLLREYL